MQKSLYFGFLIWFFYSFDQTTKSLYDLFFRPFCALIFLMLISVFASMSASLSSFQHLHKPYPILLLSECWRLVSAYFMNFIFLLVQFLAHSLSWLAHNWLVPVVSKKLENSAFFLGNTPLVLLPLLIFCDFTSCLISLSFSIYCNLNTMYLYVGITILNQYQPTVHEK